MDIETTEIPVVNPASGALTPGGCGALDYDATDYRSEVKPVWCPGCGDCSVLSALTAALADMNLVPKNVALISGIGCSSRIPAYANVYGFHGVHGRALPIATGLKLARPELTVLVASGDGDGLSIGGNHFLHACRRNVDMTCIIMDNQVYGMTKGQASPTTDPDWVGGRLTPEGTGVNAFDPLYMAMAGGATFLARCFSGDPVQLAETLVEAINHHGFSVIHILSPCVTFRPEQREWKNFVRRQSREPTAVRLAAGLRLIDEDKFNIGIIYKDNREVFQLPQAGQMDPKLLDEEFVV